MNKIIRIKAGQNYSTFHFREGNTLLISKNIGVYEGSLDEYDFMRVHRSHIVNLHCVGRFIRLDGGYLIMEDQSRVAVSNAKKEELLLRLKEL